MLFQRPKTPHPPPVSFPNLQPVNSFTETVWHRHAEPELYARMEKHSEEIT